jgi:hypothetical protein
MTKSRTLPALFLAVLQPLPLTAQTGLPDDRPALPQPGTAAAPTIVTADEAIAMGRARVHEILDTECPPGLSDEVVVCGRRLAFQRYRVPMADPVLGRGTACGPPMRSSMRWRRTTRAVRPSAGTMAVAAAST